MTDVIDRLGGALAGRYTLVRELGRGGMATVYLARDLRHFSPDGRTYVLPGHQETHQTVRREN